MKENQDKRKMIIWIVLGLVAVIIIVVIILAIVNSVSTSESSLENRLERYATELYETNLKSDGSTKYNTMNLDYLERYNYDVSVFESQSCDKSNTYAVVVVNEDREIERIVTNLQCGNKASDENIEAESISEDE